MPKDKRFYKPQVQSNQFTDTRYTTPVQTGVQKLTLSNQALPSFNKPVNPAAGTKPAFNKPVSSGQTLTGQPAGSGTQLQTGGNKLTTMPVQPSQNVQTTQLRNPSRPMGVNPPSQFPGGSGYRNPFFSGPFGGGYTPSFFGSGRTSNYSYDQYLNQLGFSANRPASRNTPNYSYDQYLNQLGLPPGFDNPGPGNTTNPPPTLPPGMPDVQPPGSQNGSPSRTPLSGYPDPFQGNYPTQPPGLPPAPGFDPNNPFFNGGPSSTNLPGVGAPGDWLGYDSTQRDALVQYYSNVLPFLQASQNAAQWNREFGENAARWRAQFGWQQQQDVFNMGLTERQQQMAELQQKYAQENWLKQFSHTQLMDLAQQKLAEGRFGLESELGRANQALQERIQTGKLQIDQERQRLAEQVQLGQLGIQEANQRLQELLGKNKMEIDKARQKLEETLGFRRLSLQERQQLAQEQQFGQTFGLQQQESQFNRQYRQQQLELERQRLELERERNRYSAFGRGLTPNFNYV